ncbi:hypothetical protein [Kineosporia sp. NBRC 101677]|uniref:MmyB family transcriptional regulator n=1 Tax=Kineosporia TaxID=49184 RepID=UPI00332984B2
MCLPVDSQAPSTCADWDEVALEAVAASRIVVRGREDDPTVHALLGRLSAGSTDVAELWSRQGVLGRSSGNKHFPPKVRHEYRRLGRLRHGSPHRADSRPLHRRAGFGRRDRPGAGSVLAGGDGGVNQKRSTR